MAAQAAEPAAIAAGVGVLVSDILRSVGTGSDGDGAPPRVLVLAPPLVHETPTSLGWGFAGCEARSRALIPLVARAAAEHGVGFFDPNTVAAVSSARPATKYSHSDDDAK